MNKFIAAISLLVVSSVAGAGEIRNLIQYTYDVDMIKPASNINVGTLIADGRSPFIDLDQARLCASAIPDIQPQHSADVNYSFDGKDAGVDFRILLGLMYEQSQHIIAANVQFTDSGISKVQSDKLLDGVRKQKTAGCNLIQKGTVVVTATASAKIKITLQFKSGTVDLNKISDQVLNYLGNGVSTKYDTKTNVIAIEVDQPLTIGIVTAPIDANLANLEK